MDIEPMLFILLADSLNRFLLNTRHLMPQHVLLPSETIQFVDDTIIITEAHPKTLRIIQRTLKVFSKLSGMKINQSKSMFVPIAIPDNLIQVIQDIISSPPSQLPIKYLGLPLTIKKPK
ncbi:uncharacterized protein LOC144565567 [Carex rostrata]